jgi:hypothetical protein
MLAADQIYRRTVATDSFCWSCGTPAPGGDTCDACGVSAGLKAVDRSELVGATGSVRLKLRSRSGIIVAENPTSVLFALPDASVTETARSKLTGLVNAPNGARSSAWMLVNASRAFRPDDRRQFDELVESFVLTLTDRSVDEARAFALDALDADCPGWLDKLQLTTSERDFLFASYHAHRGNAAVALERLVRLPVDRYPTKDLVFLRCLPAIKEVSLAREKVSLQLRSFAGRPIAGAVLCLLDQGSPDDESWLRAAEIVLGKTPPEHQASFGRPAAAGFLQAFALGSPLAKTSWNLGPEVRVLALAQTTRSGGLPPGITLADLHDAPEALIDDAIELGVLTVSAKEREHPLAKYVLARTDPDVLTQPDLEDLNYQSEIARRAFLHGDHEALASLPGGATKDQLRILDSLRSGEWQRALDGLTIFQGQARDKVESIARCLVQGSVDAARSEVLTDGTTWPILATLLPDDTSALNDLTTRRPALRGIAAWRALSGAVSRLWEWDWEGAVVEAKRCLLVAKDEETRDEALNLIACAEWQIGDDTDAISALSTALEGSYTEGLQVNMGIVAASLEPQRAGAQLGRLAVEAPTLSLRVAAAERALQLWFADPDPWDTQDNEQSLPAELRDALRTLVQSDIAEVSFVRFARTISQWDDEWLARPDRLDGTPFEGSPAAAVYQAKARDFEEFVKKLADVVGQELPPAWAADERDRLIGSAIAALNPDNANPTAASFGLALIDGGLPMGAAVGVDLIGFTVVAVCQGIDPTEGEPKERFLDMVVEARQRVAQIASDEQKRSSGLLDFATSRVIGSIAAARANQYDQVVEMYNDLANRLRGVRGNQINRGAVRGATQPGVDFLSDTNRILERLIAHTPDPDFKRQLTEFRDQVRTLLAAFNRLRGS